MSGSNKSLITRCDEALVESGGHFEPPQVNLNSVDDRKKIENLKKTNPIKTLFDFSCFQRVRSEYPVDTLHSNLLKRLVLIKCCSLSASRVLRLTSTEESLYASSIGPIRLCSQISQLG